MLKTSIFKQNFVTTDEFLSLKNFEEWTQLSWFNSFINFLHSTNYSVSHFHSYFTEIIFTRINSLSLKLYYDNLIHLSIFVHFKHLVSSLLRSTFPPSSISLVQMLKIYILSRRYHSSVNFTQNQIWGSAIYTIIRFYFYADYSF